MRHVKIATVHVCLRACMYIFHLCVKYLNACTLIVLKCLHVYCLFGVYMCSWVCMCRLLWVYPVPTSLAWESEQTVWVFISAGQWLKVRPERTCWVDRLSATSSGQMGLLRAWGQPTRSRVISITEVHMTVFRSSDTVAALVNMF